jgi:hypothetical protein
MSDLILLAEGKSSLCFGLHPVNKVQTDQQLGQLKRELPAGIPKVFKWTEQTDDSPARCAHLPALYWDPKTEASHPVFLLRFSC